jgi:hypothetical protein
MVPLQSIDSWPRTRRPLPWLFAGFLASIFLIPVDAIQLKVHLPFSSDFDRFFVAIICVVWAVGVIVHKRTDRLRLRPRGWRCWSRCSPSSRSSPSPCGSPSYAASPS